MQRHRLQVAPLGRDGEGAVGAALPHGVHELLLVVDAQKLQVDFRILVEEGPRYGGKPLDSDAREGSHAHKAALPIGELAHAGGQGVLVGVDRLHKTEHFAALGSKMHAAVFAQKERQSQLLFQGVHQVADAGLSVAQFLGGGLEAAEARHCEERVVFLVGHKAPPGVRISLLCVVRLHNYKTFLKCFTRSLVLLFSARSLV